MTNMFTTPPEETEKPSSPRSHKTPLIIGGILTLLLLLASIPLFLFNPFTEDHKPILSDTPIIETDNNQKNTNTETNDPVNIPSGTYLSDEELDKTQFPPASEFSKDIAKAKTMTEEEIKEYSKESFLKAHEEYDQNTQEEQEELSQESQKAWDEYEKTINELNKKHNKFIEEFTTTDDDKADAELWQETIDADGKAREEALIKREEAIGAAHENFDANTIPQFEKLEETRLHIHAREHYMLSSK